MALFSWFIKANQVKNNDNHKQITATHEVKLNSAMWPTAQVRDSKYQPNSKIVSPAQRQHIQFALNEKKV